MNLNEHEKTIAYLAGLGAIIAFGKLMASGKKMTIRLFIGRLIIGSGLSMAAGTALALTPDMSPVGLIGLGAALGISGIQSLEKLLQLYFGKNKSNETGGV